MEPGGSALGAWETFYVIVGGGAAALTGLQFVVVTLIADSHMRRTQREINAFGTPTVFHFSVVLLISAVLSAPWREPGDPAYWIALSGFAGLIYGLITHLRIRAQARARLPGAYQPVLEDVIWYQVVPALGYIALLASGIALRRHHPGALYLIAGVALALLFIAIRNAWDTVTFVVEQRSTDDAKS